MQQYLLDLNHNQYKAVTTIKKKTLVMAGAGSGKTRVLTTRIKFLVDNGADIKQICAFTFTNKAANEMKNRYKEMMRADDSSLVTIETPTISTFHSFCYSYLMIPDLYRKLGYTKAPDVISDSVKADLIKEILKGYNEDYSNIPFVTAISNIKNKAKVKGVEDKDMFILNSVYFDYQQRLKESNQIDFDDMIPLFLKLCEDSWFQGTVQRQFILVDECQDTNMIQYELIKKLSDKYQRVFMVGDEDQLIYSFRSSDISILNDFKDHADEIFILNRNYRCNKDILEHANSLIDYNSNRIKKELFSEIEPIKNVQFNEYASTMSEAEAVADKIENLLESGSKLKDIAILFRNNNQSYAIEKELKTRKIPYQLFGGKPFFEYVEIRALIYAYRSIFNPTNIIAFNIVADFVLTRLEKRELDEFRYAYQRVGGNVHVFASGYAINPKIQKLGQSFLMLSDAIKTMTVLDFFDCLLESLRFNKYLKESKQQKPQYGRIMAFKDMIKDLDKEDVENSFNQLILENVEVRGNDAISLLTIHKAKGLEFEIVFVIGFNEGILPGYSKKGVEREEERRLGYVAITRAKQQLYLSSAIVHFINGKMTKLKPSSFLSEAKINDDASLDFFGNYWYNH